MEKIGLWGLMTKSSLGYSRFEVLLNLQGYLFQYRVDDRPDSKKVSRDDTENTTDDYSLIEWEGKRESVDSVGLFLAWKEVERGLGCCPWLTE